jgi:hypothetical protein
MSAASPWIIQTSEQVLSPRARQNIEMRSISSVLRLMAFRLRLYVEETHYFLIVIAMEELLIM